MIVISNSLVLAAPASFQPNNPVIGWHNLVTAENVSSLSEAEGFPITNVANPLTAPGASWQAEDVGDETIEVAIETIEEIDYLGLARHNLGSAGIVVAVEGSVNFGVTWFELVQETLLANDAPVIFRFTPQSLTNVRLLLVEGSLAATLAVLYAGKLLALQRRIYVGHPVLPYNRKSAIVNGRSEAGDFLGRIVLSESFASSLDLQNITPAFYRAQMQPWIEAAVEAPWFFAWRPGDYPQEVGYCFATSDVAMSNQRRNGMVQVSLSMNGVL